MYMGKENMVFFLILLLIISLPNFVSPSSQNALCPRCGALEVPYPLSTGNNCGDQRYMISCNNGGLEFISADGFRYKILQINQNARKLVINPPNIPQKTCSSSDLTVGGFHLNESLPFNISTRNTVFLLNCSENILSSPLNCSSNSFCREYEDNKAMVVEGCRDTLCCHYLKDSAMTSHRIRIRVGGCTAYTSVVDIHPNEPVGSWSFGVELQWAPPS